MSKQKLDYTEIEANYINDQNTYRDESANVFFKSEIPAGYTVYAKPVQGSERSYKFKEKDNNSAYFVAQNLMDKSVGYSFEVRNNRIICKPTTSKAILIINIESGLDTALALVRYLREQEVVNRRKYNATKGFSLVKKMINDNLTEDELYESLFDTIDENIEECGNVWINNTMFYDAKVAKRQIARNDLNKAIDKATEKYEETIDKIGY